MDAITIVFLLETKVLTGYYVPGKRMTGGQQTAEIPINRNLDDILDELILGGKS